MNSMVALEIPHVATWSKIGPKWGHFGSILGCRNSVESTNPPISPLKRVRFGPKMGLCRRPSKGVHFGSKGPKPGSFRTIPKSGHFDPQNGGAGDPGSTGRSMDSQWTPDLHPRFVFAFIVCTMERNSFWVQIGSILGYPFRDHIHEIGVQMGSRSGAPHMVIPSFAMALSGALASPSDTMFTTG